MAVMDQVGPTVVPNSSNLCFLVDPLFHLRWNSWTSRRLSFCHFLEYLTYVLLSPHRTSRGGPSAASSIFFCFFPTRPSLTAVSAYWASFRDVLILRQVFSSILISDCDFVLGSWFSANPCVRCGLWGSACSGCCGAGSIPPLPFHLISNSFSGFGSVPVGATGHLEITWLGHDRS
jgi:hypothetical protein